VVFSAVEGPKIEIEAGSSSDDEENPRLSKDMIYKNSSMYSRSSTINRNSSVYEEYTRESFDVVKDLGKGAYGTVLLVKHRNTDTLFALKELEIAKI
jgi:serine/threonine-protein kinase Psk1